jgi:3-hydroxyacyl-CoA dehydrogenase/enoyl-CoA hydratase/3-hydroxybutyryl-CoA epimerase
VKQEALDKGVADIRALFSGLVSRGKMSQAEMDAIMAKLRSTLAYADMSECDIVIEAVAEVMYVKKLVRSELEKAISGKPFIFATNTSSLSVSEMGNAHAAANERQKDLPAARNPENIVGLHFFNPVHKMPLVEVVRGEHTSAETIAVAKAFAMKLGKTTVVTTDSPGFIVNRILTPYMLETIRLVEQGVPPADIDKAMKTYGMPMGPLELMDEVGLDICAHVVDTMHGALGERLAPAAIMAHLKAKNLLGKKGGKGIYLWDAPGGKKVFDKKAKKYVFNPEVIDAITAPKSPKHVTEIQDRLALAMVNEAARCMQEGIVDDPSQLDLAMIFGTGFPPFRGGVLRYADTEGLAVIVQKLEWLAKVAGENYEPAPLLREMAKRGQTFYR